MYTAFFNLKEVPFSIAPNPHFLFMSDRHREALSHLNHGLGDTGGFVLLTGEVGTGKTTISRCLMEQLPDNIQSAFILNPTLSSKELLATICDELKIRYRKTGATLKYLTDKIQEKLLKNHQNDLNTLLIIDEAQHLQPEVLEQLRLLTNLETNTKKLLQVILIGQPELQALLRRRDLRQLAQRITARYHLLPLNKSEVSQYIKHRLSVAECYRPLFTKSALNTIHTLSQGIPRLINLLCDRALMNAYNANDAVVSKKIILKSSVEALGEEYLPVYWWQQYPVKILLATSALLLMLASGFWLGQDKGGDLPQLESSKEKVEPLKDKTVSVEPAIKSVVQTISPKISTATIEKTTEDSLNISALPKNSAIAEKSTQSLPDIESPQKVPDSPNYSVNKVEGVSDDLLSLFQSAIDETKPEIKNGIPNGAAQIEVNNQNIPPLSDMPRWVQEGVPSLNFNMHIYASDGEGWVRVNDRDRYEGDKISADLFISEILPQKVVLTYRGEKFTLPALSSW